MSGDWTYDDALPDHPWTKLYRLPAVRHWRTEFHYCVAVVVPTDDNVVRNIMMPTDREAAMLSSYQDYLLPGLFNEPVIRRMRREAPFYVDGCMNTRVFMKRETGWCFDTRRSEDGPWPVYGDRSWNLSLVDLLNILERNPASRWPLWKRDHPEVFAAA